MVKRHKQNKFFKEVERLVYSGVDIFNALEGALIFLDEDDKELVGNWLKENKPMNK